MGRTIRVLYVIDKMPLGGTQTHLDTLLRRVEPLGVEPALCCIEDLGRLGRNVRADGVLVLNLRTRRLLSLRGLYGTFKLSRTIREGGFDLVHSYLFSSNVMAPIAARLAGVPVITSRRDTGFWAARRHRMACRMVNRITHAITVNSEAVRQATLASEGVDPAKVHFIPNGIPPRPTRRNGRCAVIGSVGNLKPVKGHACLIRAFGRVREDEQNLSLHLYGDGPEKQRLRCTADAIGLNGQVVFESGRSAGEVLDAIDIFVLPSLSEGCSNALLEAMAAGLPVVATDIPANQEVICNGVDGLLVPVGDYTAMARAIRSLVRSPQKRAALGTAAIQKAGRYSVEAMVAATRRVYDEVLQNFESARTTKKAKDTIFSPPRRQEKEQETIK